MFLPTFHFLFHLFAGDLCLSKLWAMVAWYLIPFNSNFKLQIIKIKRKFLEFLIICISFVYSACIFRRCFLFWMLNITGIVSTVLTVLYCVDKLVVKWFKYISSNYCVYDYCFKQGVVNLERHIIWDPLLQWKIMHFIANIAYSIYCEHLSQHFRILCQT